MGSKFFWKTFSLRNFGTENLKEKIKTIFMEWQNCKNGFLKSFQWEPKFRRCSFFVSIKMRSDIFDQDSSMNEILIRVSWIQITTVQLSEMISQNGYTWN